jgi:hypothetical protein
MLTYAEGPVGGVTGRGGGEGREWEKEGGREGGSGRRREIGREGGAHDDTTAYVSIRQHTSAYVSV